MRIGVGDMGAGIAGPLRRHRPRGNEHAIVCLHSEKEVLKRDRCEIETYAAETESNGAETETFRRNRNPENAKNETETYYQN